MLEYTADTTNTTNKVTAVASDAEATVEVILNGAVMGNGSNAPWIVGENVLLVKVTSGESTTTYTVTVNKP